MAVLSQYDWIFVVCLLAAGLDAYNIGANDVANTLGPAVSSRSISLRQAVLLAAVTEFCGAVLAGARVSGTIRYGIVRLETFQGEPGLMMLGMTTALCTSATWLMICTRAGWPVSTTYSLVSALAGMGVAMSGPDSVNWGWNGGRGLGTIFAGMGIAPAISAAISIAIYLIVKYSVLARKESFRAGLIFAPFTFFVTSAVLALTIILGGAPALGLEDMPAKDIALAVLMTGLVIAILCIVFYIPYVYCKVQRKDYTIKWYHIFFGPLLWRRPAPEQSLDEIIAAVPDYTMHIRDQNEDVELEGKGDVIDPEAGPSTQTKIIDGQEYVLKSAVANPPLAEVEKDMTKEIVGAWILPRNLWVIIRYKIPGALLHGMSVDIHEKQAGSGSAEQNRIREMHRNAKQYPNEVEHLFSLMAILVCAVASFSHGANDVSNAIGPLASTFQAWQVGAAALQSESGTPIWILAYGAIWIVIGLATYGYNIMAVLGSRLTLHSPSRSFAISLGAAITSLMAAQLGIPASTTMCIVGATAGVGLVSSGWRSLNYRQFGYIILGWVLTIPVVGTASGVLVAIIINSPRLPI